MIPCMIPRICFQITVLLFALGNKSYFKTLKMEKDSMKGANVRGLEVTGKQA